MVTVAPGSPLPVTVVPSVDTATSVAADGAVVSGAVTVAAVDSLPAESFTFTDNVSPFIAAGLNVTVNSPLAGTVAVPNTLPFASVMVTVAPGSPLPVTVVPSVDTATSVAADGAVVSVDDELDPPLPSSSIQAIAPNAPINAAPPINASFKYGIDSAPASPPLNKITSVT